MVRLALINGCSDGLFETVIIDPKLSLISPFSGAGESGKSTIVKQMK